MSDSWIKSDPIAHRGYHWIEGVDENSWEAFEMALSKFIPIECDLHLSADGEVFVHHDYSLERMTGLAKNIGQLRASEIREIRSFCSDFSILSLKNLLNLVAGRVPLVLEIKRTLPNDQLERRVIEILNGYKGEFALQSFDPKSLHYLRKHRPNINIGLLSGDKSLSHLWWPTKILLKSMSFIELIRPNYIGYEWESLHKRAPKEMRLNRGIPLLAWTVKDKYSLNVAKLLADNIIYENLNL